MDEGFLELSVDAEALDCGGLAVQCSGGDGVLADRAGFQRRSFVDQQVGIRRVGPAVSPVMQPVEGRPQSEVVQWPDAAVDGQAAVADVEVIELQAADRARSCRVDGGQREDQPVRRARDGGDGVRDVLGL
ncbi:hypothetical protein AB0A71_35555 [Kitasatospora aureofaciens]|uniref:hypothetical protein n=1 Tax=Kitasatospora aureofaciens TaxID=1894 RepID=UPI0033D8ADFB